MVAINELYGTATLACPLEHDSTFGRLDDGAGHAGDALIAGAHRILVFNEAVAVFSSPWPGDARHHPQYPGTDRAG